MGKVVTEQSRVNSLWYIFDGTRRLANRGYVHKEHAELVAEGYELGYMTAREEAINQVAKVEVVVR